MNRTQHVTWRIERGGYDHREWGPNKKYRNVHHGFTILYPAKDLEREKEYEHFALQCKLKTKGHFAYRIDKNSLVDETSFNYWFEIEEDRYRLWQECKERFDIVEPGSSLTESQLTV